MKRSWWWFLLLMAPVRVMACMWDTDTLSAERRKAPGVLELITGKFVRHSPAYYQWRIKDRLRKLEDSPDEFALLDDLGVGYDKTGQHALAIQTARRALELDPDRYETHANLGTFLIHNRQMEEGLVHIKRAIEINPDAHFGREIIQQYLVEYVSRVWGDAPGRLPLIRVLEEEADLFSKAEKDAASVPVISSERMELQKYIRIPSGHGNRGFAAFILEKEKGNPDAIEDAIRGVTGMMRFGNYDSPILLEALADLLLTEGSSHDGHRHLAARAYLKASSSVSDALQKEAYLKMAQSALNMQIRSGSGTSAISLEEVEERFSAELLEGEQWFETVVEKEKEWIQAGVDVDQVFSRYYRKEPRAIHSPEKRTPFDVVRNGVLMGILFLGIPLLAVSVSMMWKSRIRKAAA